MNVKDLLNKEIRIEEDLLNTIWVNLNNGEEVLLKNYLVLYVLQEMSTIRHDEEVVAANKVEELKEELV